MVWRSYPTETGVRWTDDSGNDISDAQWQSEGGVNPAAAPESPYNPNNSEWYNPAMQNAAYQAGQLAYQQKRLELVDVPMLQFQKDQLAMQAAQYAVNQVLQSNLGAGNMALTAGNMGLSAAQLGTQEALGALGIAAGLRGPRNAFQQQESMHGLNAAGLSNAVGAIAGKYTLPAFKAPRAAPQGATLGTMAEDFQGAGGYGSAMAPSDYARMYADRAYQDAQRYGQGGINAAQDFYGRYGPNAQGATSGGVYNTVMGQRTIAQMRQELKNAGFPEWQSADDNTIVAKYGSTARSADGRQGMPTPVAQTQQQQIQQSGQRQDGGPAWVDQRAADADPQGYARWLEGYKQRQQMPGTGGVRQGVGGGQPGMGQYGENYSQGLMAQQAGGVANQQQAGQPGYRPSYSTSAAEYAKALPAPNKISGKAWLGLDQDSRDFLTSAYESPELGYSANYVNDQIRRGLPGFRAPSVGRVA